MNETKNTIENPGTAYLQLMRKWKKSYVDRIWKPHLWIALQPQELSFRHSHMWRLNETVFRINIEKA